ncbi:hypothetical protein AXG93_2024s1010 [Marchantia polymorpha subsp. ruderalis]|uniref:Secreted protein n=1 Tax=Marchantia polymorpha subsp. ruderalis TaxID=1480154 RepID=A0A176VJ73_MARPO|nr:hypothetical protein AXG93_2024s1010 [Marchantia polymorpha subsp. ruderalis]
MVLLLLLLLMWCCLSRLLTAVDGSSGPLPLPLLLRYATVLVWSKRRSPREGREQRNGGTDGAVGFPLLPSSTRPKEPKGGKKVKRSKPSQAQPTSQQAQAQAPDAVLLVGGSARSGSGGPGFWFLVGPFRASSNSPLYAYVVVALCLSTYIERPQTHETRRDGIRCMGLSSPLSASRFVTRVESRLENYNLAPKLFTAEPILLVVDLVVLADRGKRSSPSLSRHASISGEQSI